jgi:hypothetical protein
MGSVMLHFDGIDPADAVAAASLRRREAVTDRLRLFVPWSVKRIAPQHIECFSLVVGGRYQRYLPVFASWIPKAE